METVFQRYQRGFLGKRVVLVNQPNPTDEILKKMKNLQFNPKIFLKSETNPIFNEDIETLYAQHVNAGPGTNNIDFHEKILTAFIDAFGTPSFLEWLEVQQQSPTASYLHSKFLMDMIRFITGQNRQMAVSTWESLLNSATHDDDWEDVLAYTLAAEKEHYVKLGTVRNVAVQWCQQQNGIYDMLVTLHILFGR